MYFQYYRLSKTRLDHILKSVVFRSSFDSQQVKGSQTLVTSTWEQFYHISSLLWREKILRISFLVKFEIFGVSVNKLTADDKYPVWDFENISSLFNCNYVKHERFNLDNLFHWENLRQILNIFKKKKVVIANVPPILQTVKDSVIPHFKKRCFQNLFSQWTR